MKYPSQAYARALSDALSIAKDVRHEQKIAENFLLLLRRNGDLRKAKKIIEQVEKELRCRKGQRKIVIETARELSPSLRKLLKEKFARKEDTVEEKKDEKLIAGFKVTLDDELQFDATLARKLKTLFSSKNISFSRG